MTQERFVRRLAATLERRSDSRPVCRIVSLLFARSPAVRRHLACRIGPHALLRLTRYVHGHPARTVATASFAATLGLPRLVERSYERLLTDGWDPALAAEYLAALRAAAGAEHYQRCAASIEQAAPVDRPHPGLLLELAVARCAAGDRPAAARLARRALELEPDLPQARTLTDWLTACRFEEPGEVDASGARRAPAPAGSSGDIALLVSVAPDGTRDDGGAMAAMEILRDCGPPSPLVHPAPAVRLLAVSPLCAHEACAVTGRGPFCLVVHGAALRHPLNLRRPLRLPDQAMPVALALRVDRMDETTADSLRALAVGGPIGCADWSTVYLALNVGAEAYYSGPLAPRVGRDTSGDRIAAVADVCATTVREGAVNRIPDRLRRLCEPYVREARGRAHVHLTTARPADALAREAGPLPDQPSEGLIDVALAFDAGLVARVPPMLQSLASSTRTALRVFCFVRGVATRQTAAIARRFPEIRFRFIDMGRVDYEGTFHFFGHVTLSTMDRLLLPLVLPRLTRLIYLDTDLVVIDAIDDLWLSQTGGAGIAARPLEHPSWSPLHRLTEHIAHRRRASAVDEIRREMAARFDLGARAFNAGVLVMALDRLREARFSDETLDLSRRHGLNDNEALALWANGRFTALADRWNCIPGIEFQESPAVIHWAGPMKPWRRGEYVPHREVWQRFARAAAKR